MVHIDQIALMASKEGPQSKIFLKGAQFSIEDELGPVRPQPYGPARTLKIQDIPYRDREHGTVHGYGVPILQDLIRFLHRLLDIRGKIRFFQWL